MSIHTTLRTAKASDLDGFRKINQAVSSHPDKTEDQWKLAFMKYVDYYPLFAPQTSFALEADDGEILAYLLAEEDSMRFFSILEKEFKPKMDALQPGSFDQFVESQQFMKDFYEDYPAHLHIDVLPKCQNQKAGTRLMDALMAKLKEDGVKGVCLGVNKDRPQAFHFYEKNGFTVLDESELSQVMGRKLTY